MDVTTIRLPASNVHLVRGEGGTVLVDAGSARAVPRLRRALARIGVDPHSLSAVVLTHGHADHAGGARLLVGPDVPVVVGAPDAAVLRAGRNPALTPTNLTARVIKPFVDRPFPSYRPDVEVAEVLDLAGYGIPALAVVVGGHTPGSLAVVGVAQGGDAIVGDLVRGGWMGGALVPGWPLPHYYSADLGADAAILRGLVARFGPVRLHLGHGGPVSAVAASSPVSTRSWSPARRRG